MTRIKPGSFSIKDLKNIKPTNGKIVIVGDNWGWGMTGDKEGETAHDAYLRCSRPEQFNVYDCHKDVYVTYDGGLRIEGAPKDLTEDKLFKHLGFRVREKVS